MTLNEKITVVQTLVENDARATTALVTVYLNDAEATIKRKMYPFGYNDDDVSYVIPEMYELIQCKLAARSFLRRGAEGETSHIEDGVERTYGSVNDSDLLDEIVSKAKVVG